MDIPFGNGTFGKADLHFQTMQGNVLLDTQLFDSFDQIQYKPPSSEKRNLKSRILEKANKCSYNERREQKPTEHEVSKPAKTLFVILSWGKGRINLETAKKRQKNGSSMEQNKRRKTKAAAFAAVCFTDRVSSLLCCLFAWREGLGPRRERADPPPGFPGGILSYRSRPWCCPGSSCRPGEKGFYP